MAPAQVLLASAGEKPRRYQHRTGGRGWLLLDDHRLAIPLPQLTMLDNQRSNRTG
jgi:hypothetical protein